MRIIIAGAGDIGRQLLSDLSGTGDNEIVVVDLDEQRCRGLAEQFDALVVHGDATDPDILDKAQIGQAAALVATTGSDAVNTVIAMLGHRFEVEKIVVKITTNALRGALEEVGVTDIVAPTMAAAAKINAALHGAEQRDLSLLARGGLRIAEIHVGARADGKRLGDIPMPEGSLLVGVIRGDTAMIAREDIDLEEGDLVYAVAEDEQSAEDARQRFGD